MTQVATAAVPSVPAAKTATAAAARWHLGVALGAGALAGLLLVLLGEGAIALAWGAAGVAAVGLIGWLAFRRGNAPRLAITALWGWAAAGAVVAAGGLAGPYALFVLAPLLAALAMRQVSGVGVGVGLVLSGLAAIAGPWLVLLLGERAPAMLEGSPRSWATVLAVVAAVLAAFAALVRPRPAALSETASAPAPAPVVVASVEPRPPAFLEDSDLPERLARAERERDEARAAQHVAEAALQSAEEARRAARAVLQVTVEGRESAEAKVREAETARDAAQTNESSARARLAEVEAALTAAETRRSEAETGRERAEADAAARVRFLANMSHELRTPLNAVLGFSEIMQQRLFGPLSDKYAEYAGLIHDSGRHLLELINDVLDLAKVEADRFELIRERFDGREPVEAAMRLVRRQAEEAGLSLRGVLPSAPVEVDADRRAIKQMVLNLLSNAVKFTQPGGEVTVLAGPRDQAFEITVSDTGVGIAADDVARLGRPFEQAGDNEAKLQGSGLGLSLVRAFAELHGGSMTIESRLGQGTAVSVILPVLANAPTLAGKAEGGSSNVSPTSLDLESDSVGGLPRADDVVGDGKVVPLAR